MLNYQNYKAIMKANIIQNIIHLHLRRICRIPTASRKKQLSALNVDSNNMDKVSIKLNNCA